MRHGWWIVLGLLTALPCWAESVVMPRCPARYYDSQPTYRLVRWVKAFNQSDWDAEVKASCAGQALGRRDETVIPDLIALIEASRGSVVEFIAMEAICGKGHSGSSAIPYLLRRLPSDNSGFTSQAYGALACMGREAKPAIPYLIQKSAGDDDNSAVELLGKLAPHYPKVIVPHLIQLLDNRARAGAAADALGQAGHGARPALDALRSHLAVAVTGHQDGLASQLLSAVGKLGDPRTTVPELLPLVDTPGTRKAAVQALGEIGPPAAAAVPRLIDRLDDPEIDPTERGVDIVALAAIDKRSSQVLNILLREAASDKDPGGNSSAAAALSEIDPLPKEFAPQLIAALESLTVRANVRYQLEVALDHTHTGEHTVGSREPAAPAGIDGTLIDGIWALVQQAQPMTLEDVLKHLGLKREDYRLEGTPRAYDLDARWSVYHSRPESVPVSHATLYGFDWASTTQEVRINFNERFCLAASSVGERVPDAASSVIDYRTVFQVKVLPGDGNLAHESSLAVGPWCSGYIAIEKHFDRSVGLDPARIDGPGK